MSGAKDFHSYLNSPVYNCLWLVAFGLWLTAKSQQPISKGQ